MAEALPITLMLVGATLWLASVLVVILAAPDEKVPWNRNPRHGRGMSLLLRFLGLGTIIFTVTAFLRPVMGYWAAIPMVVAFAPAFLAIAMHNATVTRRASLAQRPESHDDGLTLTGAGGRLDDAPRRRGEA